MSSWFRSGLFIALGLGCPISCTTGVVGTPIVTGAGDTGQRAPADGEDADSAGDSAQDSGHDGGDSAQDSAQDSGPLNSGRDTGASGQGEDTGDTGG